MMFAFMSTQGHREGGRGRGRGREGGRKREGEGGRGREGGYLEGVVEASQWLRRPWWLYLKKYF